MDRGKKPSIFTLMFLISFASVGAVLYTPALPAIMRDFGVSVGQAQSTVTAYLIGYAIGQLPYGPLSNALGRRRTIYVGCSLAILGSLLCVLSDPLNAFSLLMAGRFTMALGMAVGLVSTFTIIADTMQYREAQKAISLASLAFSIMPGLGIMIGGFLTEYLGWVACFYFLMIYSLLVLFLTSRLPYAYVPTGLHHLRPLSIVRAYWRQAKDPSVVLGGIFLGASTGVVYVFSTKAPFIGIEMIGLTPNAYGLFMLIPTVGAICGGLLSAYLSQRLESRPLVWMGIAIMGSCVLIPLIAFAMGYVNVITLFLPMALAYTGMTVGYAAISSSVTSEATDKSNASAFMAFLNMAVGSSAVLIVSIRDSNSALSLPVFQLALVGLMLASLLVYIGISRVRAR